MMMEALHSSETSVLTEATRLNIAEGCVLHSHCGENLKSYKTINNIQKCDNESQRTTRCHVPENSILQSHDHMKLKSQDNMGYVFMRQNCNSQKQENASKSVSPYSFEQSVAV
jgi:hypothetical protein